MATSFAPLSISVGGSHLKSSELFLANRHSSLVGPKLAVQRKSNIVTRRNLASPLRAEYRDNRGGGGGELIASFLLGGAIFGTLACVFAPQIRRAVLNEDEYGFRKARRPIYYDEGLELRETLNEKIGQLNSVIDNISSRLTGNNNKSSRRRGNNNKSSRLRGNNKVRTAAPKGSDPEVEATI